ATRRYSKEVFWVWHCYGPILINGTRDSVFDPATDTIDNLSCIAEEGIQHWLSSYAKAQRRAIHKAKAKAIAKAKSIAKAQSKQNKPTAVAEALPHSNHAGR